MQFVHLLIPNVTNRPLITEIHFQGDAKKNDPMYRVEKAIALEEKKVNGTTFQTGVFDIVLVSEG